MGFCVHDNDLKGMLGGQASGAKKLVTGYTGMQLPEGLIQKQDPKDALLCRAW